MLLLPPLRAPAGALDARMPLLSNRPIDAPGWEVHGWEDARHVGRMRHRVVVSGISIFNYLLLGMIETTDSYAQNPRSVWGSGYVADSICSKKDSK